MKVLMLSRYSRQGASSRLRTYQYAPYLQASGIVGDQRPLLSDRYLTSLYKGKRAFGTVIAGYLGRAVQLLGQRPDVLWIEKEALPWVPWALERALLPRGVPVVTDYDDAVFHHYDLHSSPAVRALLERKIDHVMAASALVIVGNTYLADRARKAGAARIWLVPTVVDTHAYMVQQLSRTPSIPRIGWIGTPSTWTEYMKPIMPTLIAVAAAEEARITAIGAGIAAEPHPLMDGLPWSEMTEVSQIQKMDVGIMPLADTPWARGKCGYKLIQYMACGLPVVASPVGVNSEIVEHGVNGFLADSEAEWREALVRLLRDPDLRRRMGAEGRRKVESEYSLQVWGPRVAKMMITVAGCGACSI